LEAAMALYDQAKFEDGQTINSIAFLTANTPNRGLESLLRASHRNGRPISAKDLIAQKSADVQAYSEETLTVLDTSRVSINTQLQGINSSHPQKILARLAQLLAEGNPNMPSNILLVGPPATGKSEMAQVMARQARVPAYQMNSPKDGIVGETERKSSLQQRVLVESAPNLSYVDEITEMMPLERSDFNGDSGATNAISAALLTALADESRRGRLLLLGSTNCVWRIGSAMVSRFVMIPVLHPLERDYPAIIIATAQRVGNVTTELTPRTILFAAQDCTISGDRDSAIYSDLWAVSACTSKSYFPWSDCLSSYAFPPHLQGLVDLQTGDINRTELQRRIQELKPNANV
jgi:hypothetical protein